MYYDLPELDTDLYMLLNEQQSHRSTGRTFPLHSGSTCALGTTTVGSTVFEVKARPIQPVPGHLFSDIIDQTELYFCRGAGAGRT